MGKNLKLHILWNYSFSIIFLPPDILVFPRTFSAQVQRWFHYPYQQTPACLESLCLLSCTEFYLYTQHMFYLFKPLFRWNSATSLGCITKQGGRRQKTQTCRRRSTKEKDISISNRKSKFTEMTMRENTYVNIMCFCRWKADLYIWSFTLLKEYNCKSICKSTGDIN